MPHRELLTESQRLSLQTPVTDERGMVRHYMLSSEDLALINRRRGDPNRLGFALMLCYLRFPGRILQRGEQPPAALCAFVAEQLSLDAAHFGDYAERDQTRREHVLEIETALGLAPIYPRLVSGARGVAVADGARHRSWTDAGGYFARGTAQQAHRLPTVGGHRTAGWLGSSPRAATTVASARRRTDRSAAPITRPTARGPRRGRTKHAGVVAADRLCSYDWQFPKADRATEPGSRPRHRARARHAGSPELLA